MAAPVITSATSTLTLEQLHLLFREVTASMSSKIGSLRGNSLNYFTPTSIGGDDGDTASFGATVPTASGWHGGDVTVHMYVRQAGGVREVQLYAPCSFGSRGAAKKALHRLQSGMKL